MYIDLNKKNNKEGSIFKVGDHTRISKYNNMFAKTLCSKLVGRRFFACEIVKWKGEIPSITNSDTTTALNAKIYEVKNKIPNIANVATTTQKTDYNTKLS